MYEIPVLRLLLRQRDDTQPWRGRDVNEHWTCVHVKVTATQSRQAVSESVDQRDESTQTDGPISRDAESQMCDQTIRRPVGSPLPLGHPEPRRGGEGKKKSR